MQIKSSVTGTPEQESGGPDYTKVSPGPVPPIVRVAGDDALLVEAARRIEHEAVQRSKAEEANSGLINPLVIYDSAEDIAIVNAANELCEDYRAKLQLPVPPYLLPSDPPEVIEAQVLPYSRTRRDTPSAMDLERLFLQRVQVKRFQGQLYAWDRDHYVSLDSDDLHKLILSQVRREMEISGSASQIAAVETLLLADPDIESLPLDNDNNFLAVANGILRLQDFTLLPPTPDRFFVCRLTVPWLGPRPCPRFDQFLAETFKGDAELSERLLEIIGYLLVNDNRAKRFFLFQGPGDSGKSLTGNLISSFFDDGTQGTIDIFRLGDRFSPATLLGKRVNISMEIADHVLNPSAINFLKLVTGGDRVTVERKYREPVAVRLDCRFLFASNGNLRLTVPDQAFLRRVAVVPFAHPVTNPDRHLLQRLLEERPGILYRSLTAYIRLVQRSYVFAGDARTAAAATLDRGDGIEVFVSTCCLEAPESSFVATGVLFDAYSAFCRGHGYRPISSASSFSRRLGWGLRTAIPDAKLKKKRTEDGPTNVYTGLILRSID